MSVDKQIVELFAAAAEAGRSDVMQAIGSLMPITELVNRISKSPETLNDGLAQAFLQSNYSREHAHSLCDRNPTQYEPVRNLLVAMAVKGPEEVRWEIVQRLERNGHGEHALQALHTVEDLDGLRADSNEYRSNFAHKKAEYHFIVTTSPGHIDRAILRVHDALNIEVPGDFTGDYGSNSRGEGSAWTSSRLDSMMNWVSDVIEAEGHGIPTAIKSNTGVSIKNGALAHAWLQEHGRVQTLGKWHQNNFPSLFPVLVDASTASSLARLGAVTVKPAYEVTREHEYNKELLARPTHGFEPAHEGELSLDAIKLSTSLLPYETIHQLRKPGASYQLVLVPVEAMRELDIQADTASDELRLAMRFHRPEILVSREFSVTNNAGKGIDGSALYLRGVNEGDIKDLNIWRGPQDYDILRHYDSPAEQQRLKDLYAVQSYVNDTKSISLKETVPGDIQLSISKSLERLETLKNYLGFMPHVYIVGSRPFVEAFSHVKVDYARAPSLVITNAEGQAEQYEESKNYTLSDVRMRARIFPPAALADKTAAELVTSGVRLKDENEIAKICGVLDRLEPHEVYALGTTRPRALFLKEHFDFTQYMDQLPSPMRNIVGREKVEADFGL